MPDIETVRAGALGFGRSKRITLTAGLTVIVVPTPPGRWQYVRVLNVHATALVSVAVDEDPVAAPAAVPPVLADYEVGYDIGPGMAELIPLAGPAVGLRVLSDTATTPVAVNWVL